jgi:hypothetical protein
LGYFLHLLVQGPLLFCGVFIAEEDDRLGDTGLRGTIVVDVQIFLEGFFLTCRRDLPVSLMKLFW